MPNQKGSLIDRLRSWQMFLKYRREQRKKLREIKRKKKQLLKEKQILVTGKYYSKPKVFVLTIIGLFLGIFEPKTKKINIENEIVNLERKLKKQELVIEDIKNIEKLDKMLNEKKERTIISKKELNYVERLNVIKESIKKEKNINNDFANQKKNEDNKLKENKVSSDLEYSKKTKRHGVYTPILEVKEINKDLDKYSKKLNNLKSKINQENEYNNLFDYTFEIKQLKIKIEEILVKYEYLKQSPGFASLDDCNKIKDIDLYEIRNNNKKIKDKISFCNELLLKIDERKKEIIVKEKIQTTENNNVNKKIDKKDTKNETQKEIKKEEREDKLIELTLANKIIYDNLIKEQRKLTKLERMLTRVNIKKRKPTIFYYTKNLVSSIFNLTFSLFPFNIFKNKMLGGLVSGIMINNSLRSVKRILKPEVEVTYLYYDLEKEISSTTNYLNRMDYVLNDSLNKINDIRCEILNKYSNDITYRDSLNSYLDELSKIQSKIEFERAKVLGLHQDLNQIYKKNKQKVLTIDRYNSQ